MPSYSDLIKNKRIAIIGGAPNVDWQSVKKFDLVIQTNDHWAKNGQRVDILYCSCAADLDYAKIFAAHKILNGLQWAWLNKTHTFFGPQAGRYHEMDIGLSFFSRNIDHYYLAPKDAFRLAPQLDKVWPKDNWLRSICEEWDMYPFTGLIPIIHIASFEAKEIYIDGMNFFTQNGLTPKRHGCHHIENQLKYLKALYEKDSRIVLCDDLLALTLKTTWGYVN